MSVNYEHLTKICVKVVITSTAICLLLAYYSVYAGLSETRRDYAKTIAISNQSSEEIYVPPFSDEILEFHRRLNLTDAGYMGKPVMLPEHLPDDIQAEVNRSLEQFKFNEFVSRLIPLDRQLPDYRKGTCKTANYSSDLPKVSVVMSFYNEPFSMVMRTIYSILKRSPPELIEEILLVDDCSDNGWFTGEIS